MITIDYAMNVATHLQMEGKLPQAKIILNSILEVQPTHAYALHLSGIIAYQTGDMTLAIQLIQKAIASHSAIALFHTNLAEMHRLSKDIDASIQSGQRALMLDPNSSIVLSNLGIAFYDAKQYERAKDCHQRALALNPTLSCSLNNMGSIHKILGEVQKALTFYEAAIAASPNVVEPYNNLGVLFLEQQEFKQALSYFHRAIALMPNFADAYCNMGLALIGLEQYDEAFVCFEKTLQFTPNNAEAYYGLAKVYLNKHDFYESEHNIRQAIAINSQQIEFFQLMAEIYQEQGKNIEALRYLDHAFTIDSSASLYISKGNVLMEMGEISKAEEQFLKITKDPSMHTRILAYYCLTQLRQAEANNPLLKTLLLIANNIQAVSTHKQSYVYFALGKCYEDRGEWENAFKYFKQGCEIKRQGVSYNITEQIQLTHHIMAIFTKESVEYLRTFANLSTLPIFIVGMPRSGTTLVEQILASHPEVYGAGELACLTNLIHTSIKMHNTQLHYPENMLHLSSDAYSRITTKYLSCLRHISAEAMRITDKMPHNFMVLGLIHALLPNAKIIHVKRNPMDTCVSCYTKLFSKGHYYSYDLTELGQYYKCYEKIMDHWRHILPSNAWLDIQYEDLTTELETQVKRLIAYCELTWSPACLAFYRSQRNVRTASFMQVRQPIYTSSVNRWRRYEKELAPLIKIL